MGRRRETDPRRRRTTPRRRRSITGHDGNCGDEGCVASGGQTCFDCNSGSYCCASHHCYPSRYVHDPTAQCGNPQTNERCYPASGDVCDDCSNRRKCWLVDDTELDIGYQTNATVASTVV